jgi:hypothetical protein
VIGSNLLIQERTSSSNGNLLDLTAILPSNRSKAYPRIAGINLGACG